MKSRKTVRQPVTDLQRWAKRVEQFRLPGGPVDYAVRAQAAEDARHFFHEVVLACRTSHMDGEARAVIEAARRLFHAALEAAYPPGFWEDCERLKKGDSSGLKSAVLFLEADPWFFRSGYVKTWLIRLIKPPMLTSAYRTRLANVVLSVVDKRDDRDFRAFCRLARKVDAPELRDGLTRRLAHDDPDVRRRARWVLEALEQGKTRK